MENEVTAKSEPILQQLIDAEVEKKEARAKELSAQMNKKITAVCFSEEDEEGGKTGKVFAAYVQQPHFIAAVKAMDLIAKRDIFTAGLGLFEVMVIMEISDKEVTQDGPYKIGLLPRLTNLIDIKASEVKKS